MEEADVTAARDVGGIGAALDASYFIELARLISKARRAIVAGLGGAVGWLGARVETAAWPTAAIGLVNCEEGGGTLVLPCETDNNQTCSEL